MASTVNPASPADELRALRKEHEKLQHALAVRDHEIAALREIAEAAGQLQSQDTQAAKVIELSKKNRALNLMLEKEKQRAAQLQQSLSEATQPRDGASAQKIQAAARSAVEQAAEAADSAAKEAAVWRERAQQQTNKMSQLEQKVFALEGENRKLARALAREVGEDVPLAKVLEEGSDWKGRREAIIALKDTIRKLREERGAPLPSKHDEVHRNTIGKISKERAAEMERVAAELAAAKAAAEQLRRQYAGASSRRKVLEEELAAARDKMAVVLRKTKNDDRLITALRAELAAAVQAGGSGRHIRASVTGVDSPSGGQEHVWTEVAQLRQQVVEQDEQLEQSAKVIRYLQAQLQQPAAAGALGGGGGAAGKEQLLLEQLEAAQDECDELRGQVRALQDDLEQLQAARPGTSGLSCDLRRQVQALQEENDRLHSGLKAMQQEGRQLRGSRSDAGRGGSPGGAAGSARGGAGSGSRSGVATADTFVVGDAGADEDDGGVYEEDEGAAGYIDEERGAIVAAAGRPGGE